MAPSPVKYGGSMAEANAHKKALMVKYGLKRTEVDIEEIEVPSGKAGLLEFLNSL